MLDVIGHYQRILTDTSILEQCRMSVDKIQLILDLFKRLERYSIPDNSLAYQKK